MENSHLVKLTLVLYKITDSFPKEEPLKFAIRERANSILGNAILCFAKNPVSISNEQRNKVINLIHKDIEVLQSYFMIAKEQEWTQKDFILVLAKEYHQILGGMKIGVVQKKFQSKEKKDIITTKPFPKIERKRCREILNMLQHKEPLQVKDLEEVFHGISKRTLRRDFEYLMHEGLVKRVGDKSDTGYISR